MADGERNLGGLPAARANVIAVLREHGVTGDVAARLWHFAQDLRVRTRRRGIEHAVTLDMGSGEQVDSMLTGTATSTDISEHVRAFLPDRRYVVLHTHPRSTSMSNFDVLTLTSQPQIVVLIVVGVNGTWFVTSRQPGKQVSDPRSAFDAYQTTYRELESQGVSFDERPHAVMERIATDHGIRYDQVVGR